MTRSTATARLGIAMGLSLSATACGGGAPLMHPAHPLPEGDVTVGAGFSGRVAIAPSALSPEDTRDRALEEGAVAPGLAPWVGGRVGIGGDWEGGVTYTGRSARADIRHAFVFDDLALSVGLGASGLLPKRDDDLRLRVGGFGFDVPVLFGWRSDADLYSLWIGPRGGAEYLNGQQEIGADPLEPDRFLLDDVSGWHAFAGGVLGMRIGFRYVFAVLEVDGAMHWAGGSIGDEDVSVSQFAVEPGGAIVVKF